VGHFVTIVGSHLQADGKGAKHLEHEVSRFEKMLEGITRVLDAG